MKTKVSKAFAHLKQAERLLAQCIVSGDNDYDYRQLHLLLGQERLVDQFRSVMLQQHVQGSYWANEYLFREYMIRYNISKFALKLDRKVTNRIIGRHYAEKSAVAIYIKNRKLYPLPVKAVENKKMQSITTRYWHILRVGSLSGSQS